MLFFDLFLYFFKDEVMYSTVIQEGPLYQHCRVEPDSM